MLSPDNVDLKIELGINISPYVQGDSTLVHEINVETPVFLRVLNGISYATRGLNSISI